MTEQASFKVEFYPSDEIVFFFQPTNITSFFKRSWISYQKWVLFREWMPGQSFVECMGASILGWGMINLNDSCIRENGSWFFHRILPVFFVAALRPVSNFPMVLVDWIGARLGVICGPFFLQGRRGVTCEVSKNYSLQGQLFGRSLLSDNSTWSRAGQTLYGLKRASQKQNWTWKGSERSEEIFESEKQLNAFLEATTFFSASFFNFQMCLYIVYTNNIQKIPVLNW